MKLNELERFFPKSLPKEKSAGFKTAFYKRLSLEAHRFYKGKLLTIPRVPIDGLSALNLWYTPGVSSVSTAIRDNHDDSFSLTGRGNRVAIVSDSTRVLGDGDCSPAGGLGVMEGKALLMNHLAGIDAVPLCIDNRDESGNPDPQKVIDFVKMLAPSFGAINLEDISQPNCFRILDTLTQECPIPVWHDDAQGTACAVLAGLFNALKLVGKELKNCRIILFGAGAANTSVARLLMEAGADARKLIFFDSKGTLHKNRMDYAGKPECYRQWQMCEQTNTQLITSYDEAFSNADVVVALSKPGPDVLKKEWIASMAEKAIVFACANPIPEIYPDEALDAGAYVVATGRGDFPNQINNSIVFPAVLKGVLTVAASKITDSMALAAAKAIAAYAESKGIDNERIVPTMFDTEMVPLVAAEVARVAVSENLAKHPLDYESVKQSVRSGMESAQQVQRMMQEEGIIKELPESFVIQVVDSILPDFQ